MKRSLSYIYVSLFIVLSVVSACTEKQRKQYAATPTAYGRIDNIVVVTDDYTWKSPVGDTFRTHFEALYPVTPQPEPILDIRHIDPKTFTSQENTVLKTHRAIIILGSLDADDRASELIKETLGENKINKAKEDKSYRIAISRDRWAKGQMVVYWFAPTQQELLESISRDYKKVLRRVHEADDAKLLQEVYAMGEEKDLSRKVKDNFGLTLRIPKEYFLAHVDSQAFWARYETNKVSSSIFVATVPIDSVGQLTADNHHDLRDTLTRKYFSTWIEGSYMQIDDRYLPVYYQYMQIENRQALQARGLWGMVNDFMGGSFVSYLIRDEPNNRYILLDGFVHAPGEDKRPKMRKLDIVFSTFKLNS